MTPKSSECGSELHVPEALKSTWRLVKAAFPSGVRAEDVRPLARLLVDHMSGRQLAKLLEFFTDGDYSDMTVVVHACRRLDIDDPSVGHVLPLLETAGYWDWVQEELLIEGVDFPAPDRESLPGFEVWGTKFTKGTIDRNDE